MLFPRTGMASAGISLMVLAGTSTASAQPVQPGQEPVITVNGQDFATWQEYTSSAAFQDAGLRCGSRLTAPRAEILQSDCSFTITNIKPEYDPIALYQIPVVVHVIENTSGQGQISDALVQSQIDILNEDFRAMPGTNGANGTDTMIEFYLATEDPNGNPTNGITRSVNNTWFNDGGSYWNTLAWDTNRYLNIYTNSASGALGYVPNLPQGGIVGSNSDRVVVLWSSFGLNGPIGPPFDKGRTTTHEVGHYLGLDHTFSGGCAGGNCYTTGDLICDTNDESFPTFGCPGNKVSCGNSDPVDNYMDYSDDLCMEMFTPEQTNRMRCTLESWRTELACSPGSIATRFGGGSNYDTVYSAVNPYIGGNLTATVNVGLTPYNNALLLCYLAPASLDIGLGRTLLVDPSSLRVLQLIAAGPVAQWNLPVPNIPVFCGVTLYTQAYLFGGQPNYGLTNAQDWTFGYAP